MANTVTRDPHLLSRNLKLNDHYISNDGGNEGITIQDDGDMVLNSSGTATLFIKDAGGEYIQGDGNGLSVVSGSGLTLKSTSLGISLLTGSLGSVGIGTLSPSSALEIHDGETTDGSILTLSTKEDGILANHILGRINFQAPLSNVGGTAGDQRLIGASISAVAQAQFSNILNSTALHFQTGKSEDATGTTASMVIDEDGNVGIGTTAPVTPLSVSGAITIREQSTTPSAGGEDTYGQIWIKDEDPTQLWFTNDDGDDIQMTEGATLKVGTISLPADQITEGDAEVEIGTEDGSILFNDNDGDLWLTFNTDAVSGGVSSGIIDAGVAPVSEILAPSNQRLRLRTQGQQQGLQLFSGQNIEIGVWNQDFDEETSGGAIQRWKGTEPFYETCTTNHTSGISDGSTTSVRHVTHVDDDGRIVVGMRCKGRGLPEQALGEEITHVDSIASDTIFRIDTNPDETGSFSWLFMTGLYYYPSTYWGTLSGSWVNTTWIDIPQELTQNSTSIPAQVRGSASGTRAIALVEVVSNQPKVYPYPTAPGTGFISTFTDSSCDYNHTAGGSLPGDPAKATITHDDDGGKISLFMSVHGTGIPVGAYVGEVVSNTQFRIHKGGGTGSVDTDDRVAVTTTATDGSLTFYDRVVFKDPSASAWIALEVGNTGDGFVHFGTQTETAFGQGSMTSHGYTDSNSTANWNFTARKRMVMRSDNYFDNSFQIDADRIYLGGTHHKGITGQEHTDVFVSEKLYICNTVCNIPRIKLWYDSENNIKYLHMGTANGDTNLIYGFLLQVADDTGATTIITDNGTEANDAAPLTIRTNGDIILDPSHSTSVVHVDKDVTETDAGTYTALSVDFDKTGTTSSNNTLNGILIDMDSADGEDGVNQMYGIYCTPTLTYAADAGSPYVIGAYLNATGSSNGSNSTSIGLRIDQAVAGTTDTNLGLQIRSVADTSDYFSIATTTSGATTIKTVDSDAAVAHLTLDVDGDVILDPHTGITKFQFAGDPDDLCTISVVANGKTTIATADSDGALAHLIIQANGHVEFSGCGVGFDRIDGAFDATLSTVDFRTGNKAHLNCTGTAIATLKLTFPDVSGNFVLLIKHPSSGCNITDYEAFDQDGNAADGDPDVKWPGGNKPTLSDDTNHVDILSFFWDADTETAYAVASLDFQN